MSKTRHTLQREIVFQTVSQLPGHATAEKIYETIRAAHPAVARATVYRNLRSLEEAGRVMRIEVPGGADRFEVCARNHYHIKCNHCGRIFDASLPVLPRLIELEQQADAAFQITGCSLLFTGLCPECRENQEDGPQAESPR